METDDVRTTEGTPHATETTAVVVTPLFPLSSGHALCSSTLPPIPGGFDTDIRQPECFLLPSDSPFLLRFVFEDVCVFLLLIFTLFTYNMDILHTVWKDSVHGNR